MNAGSWRLVFACVSLTLAVIAAVALDDPAQAWLIGVSNGMAATVIAWTLLSVRETRKQARR